MSDEWKDFVVKKMSLESDDVNIDMILSYCQNISYLGTSDNSVKAVSNFIGITILNNNYDAFGSISSKDSQKTYIKVLKTFSMFILYFTHKLGHLGEYN